MEETSEVAFNTVYWLHQPPEVRATQSMGSEKRNLVLFQLATRSDLAEHGFLLDVPIMVWGWSPYLVMGYRQDGGYRWVPSALQPPVTIAPGLGAAGSVPYDGANPPKGSIKVSLDVADYLPWDPPPPPPVITAPDDDPVGEKIAVMLPWYYVKAWFTGESGDFFTGSRGKFELHQVRTPFGNSRYWAKV